MKRIAILVIIAALLLTGAATTSLVFAGDKDILRQGILGAGAGLAGAAAGKGKGGAWKGALAGAGVNVVGGALLDSMSGEHVSTTHEVNSMPSNQDAYGTGYKEGYNNGYKAGYAEGFKEGIAHKR